MAASKSSGEVFVVADTKQLARLSRDLIKVAPTVWAECRLALRAAGEVVASDARGRAGFSPPSQASIRIRTGRGNVKVQAGGDAAPEAAALENRGKGHPRHPLFGDRNHWYTNNTPAFLAPAFDAHREEVLAMMEDAVTHAVERAVAGDGVLGSLV